MFLWSRGYFVSIWTKINSGRQVLGVRPILWITGVVKMPEGGKKNMNLNPFSKFPFKAKF